MNFAHKNVSSFPFTSVIIMFAKHNTLSKFTCIIIKLSLNMHRVQNSFYPFLILIIIFVSFDSVLFVKVYSKITSRNCNLLLFSFEGKKGRSTAGKQGAKSMLSLGCSATLLRALFR